MTPTPKKKTSKSKSYFVYILQCSDNSFYTGITTDLVRRLQEHNESKKGAKYTRSRRPVTLVYSKKFRNHNLAAKQELHIKTFSRPRKLKLITQYCKKNANKSSL